MSISDDEYRKATPQMHKKALKILAYGLGNLSNFFTAAISSQLSRPLGEAEIFRNFETVFEPQDPRALKALNSQLSLEELRGTSKKTLGVHAEVKNKYPDAVSKEISESAWVQKDGSITNVKPQGRKAVAVENHYYRDKQGGIVGEKLKVDGQDPRSTATGQLLRH